MIDDEAVAQLDLPPVAGVSPDAWPALRQRWLDEFVDHVCGTIKLSLLNSMLAPEPGESADSYARRQATTGIPPRSWWPESLAASGVKVIKWGWGKFWAIAGITFLAIILIIVIAVLATS